MSDPFIDDLVEVLCASLEKFPLVFPMGTTITTYPPTNNSQVMVITNYGGLKYEVAIRYLSKIDNPTPMLLWCPECGARHVDVGEFATKSHHTHSCQFCGMTWRPAIVPTIGVQFLPGFKNE